MQINARAVFSRGVDLVLGWALRDSPAPKRSSESDFDSGGYEPLASRRGVLGREGSRLGLQVEDMGACFPSGNWGHQLLEQPLGCRAANGYA